MRRILELFFYVFFLCITPLAATSAPTGAGVSQAAGATHKRILILYPFNNNVPTLHQMVAGIDRVIASHNLRSADFLHEYLDIAPPKYPEQRSLLKELLLKKYTGQQFDLIITYGTIATEYLLNEGKEISPGTPCVAIFGDKSKNAGEALRKLEYVPLQLDPRGTLELGLKLFPGTRKILFVAGNSANDLKIENQARTDFAPWQGKLEFEYTSNRPVEEILKHAVNLPPNTLIIFSNVSSDITGKSFVPRDLVKVLASNTNAPVLSMFSTQIDTGVIGGAMINMELAGELIGKFMLALDSGKPITIESPTSYIKPTFNWEQIKRWGVNPDSLPADSVFVNRPLTLWGQYRAEVISALLAILVLSVMSIALLIQNRRRKSAEISVRYHADQLAAERDLLEQRVAERTAHLSEALEFNETMLLNSPLPMGIYAESGQCVMANDAYARFVGATREALLEQNFHQITSWQTTSLLGDCLAALKLHAPQQREAHVVTTFGKDVWFEYRILPRHLKGQDHLLIQFFDLTERKRVEEELRHLAFHDSLTRLPNRRLLLDRLQQALRLGKRENSFLAVLFIDLNKFKQLNDTYGHDMGDQMLVEVARRLQAVVRDSDTVARLGGDEFIVLLVGLGTDSSLAELYAKSVVEKIRGALSTEYLFETTRYQGAASVGIKLVRGGDHDPDQILKEADAAMYEIKKSAG